MGEQRKRLDSPPDDLSYSRSFKFDVVDSGQPFRTTLCWTDYPPSENTYMTLVNDLDLRIKTPDGSYLYPDNARDKTGSDIVIRSGPANVTEEGVHVPECGIIIQPSEYPAVLNRVHFWLWEFGNADLVFYEYSGEPGSGTIGSELYRTKVVKDYLETWSSYIIPLDITLESGAVFISLKVSDTDKQSIYCNGDNSENLGYIPSGGQWVLGDTVPAVSAEFISPDKVVTVDRVNNVERVSIDSPQVGTYTAEITAYQIPSGPQPYALVMSGAWENISTSGADSVGVNPNQPNAPTVEMKETNRQAKTSTELQSEMGINLDNIYSDVVEFSCEITSADNDVVSFRYAVDGLPEQAANTLALEKLLGNGHVREFNYPGVKEFSDGNWWLETISGEFVDPTRVLSAATKYYVVSVIKDNGSYDTDASGGTITDPQVLSASGSASSGSSASGGCTVGGKDDFTMLYLIVLAALLRCISILRISDSASSSVSRLTKRLFT